MEGLAPAPCRHEVSSLPLPLAHSVMHCAATGPKTHAQTLLKLGTKYTFPPSKLFISATCHSEKLVSELVRSVLKIFSDLISFEIHRRKTFEKKSGNEHEKEQMNN